VPEHVQGPARRVCLRHASMNLANCPQKLTTVKKRAVLFCFINGTVAQMPPLCMEGFDSYNPSYGLECRYKLCTAKVVARRIAFS
jgi:hypothetical protein